MSSHVTIVKQTAVRSLHLNPIGAWLAGWRLAYRQIPSRQEGESPCAEGEAMEVLLMTLLGQAAFLNFLAFTGVSICIMTCVVCYQREDVT